MNPDLPRPETVQLGECADLWLLDEAEVDDAVERYHVIDVISAEERLRYQRLRSSRARRQHLGARMLTRYVLAAYTGIRPQGLRLQTGPFGRPELVSNALGLDFNVSHTDGLIGCILTRHQRCGLDLEQTPLAERTATAILQFLSAEEQENVLQLPQPDQSMAVLDYWVIKEAYLKALGVGFTRNVSSFTVRGLNEPSIQIDDPGGDGHRRWQVELRQLRSEHRLAIALGHPLGTVDRTPIRVLDFAAFLRVAAPVYRGDQDPGG